MPDSRFKPYQQNQLRLLPLDLSEMVPENHMARVIDRVVESLDTRALEALYPGVSSTVVVDIIGVMISTE